MIPMTTRIVAWVAISSLLAAPTGLRAQNLAVDVRTVVATSTQRLAGADLSVGVGFGAALAYRLQPHLLAYGGWDWIHFQAEQSFAGSDMDFEETGYTLGLRFEHPFRGDTGPLFRVEAGGTYKHVEVENVPGDIVADSGHEFGFEAGGGVVLPLGTAWRLTPAVRFRSLTPAFDITGATTKTELRYVGVELSVTRQF
jgi:hypothetical protein